MSLKTNLCSVRVRCLAIDPVVMRSSPATGHILVRCVLLVNQPIKLNLLSWLLAYLCITST